MPQDYCLVVPCYNEAERLPQAAFETWLPNRPYAHVLFVNDGSRDATLQVLHDLVARLGERAAVFDQQPNQGKAEAVRTGMLHATTLFPQVDWIGYWDADLATPLEEVDRFMKEVQDYPNAQLLLGSRIKRLGARIERKPRRHLLGRVFATLTSLIIKLDVYDTQCGAKLIHCDLVPELFREPFVTRWLFDVELLARLVRDRGPDATAALCLEVPLTRWADIGGSKLKFKDMVAVPRQLWRIKRTYKP